MRKDGERGLNLSNTATSPVARSARGEASRTRILDAAEALFAGQGFRHTALREIATAAGVEVGMISYHFESRALLIEEVLERRAGSSARVMTGALDQVEASGDANNVAAILSAFADTILVPLEREHFGGLNYLRMAIRRMSEVDDALGPDDPLMIRHAPVRARYIAALQRALPQAEPESLRFFFDLFEGSFRRMLFDRALDVSDDDLRRTRVAELRRLLVPFCATGLGAFANGAIPENSAKTLTGRNAQSAVTAPD